MADYDEYPSSYWLDRAAESRAKAENMISENGKHWMLQIANLYDKLANEAAEREVQKKGDGSN